MELFWEHGPMYVKEIRELYEEPRPHVNTISTQVRILEANGYLAHKEQLGTYQYYAIASREDYKNNDLQNVVNDRYGQSYKRMVSSLIGEDKLSVDDLKEIIAMIEKGKES